MFGLLFEWLFKTGFTVMLLQMGYGSRAMELLQKYYEGKIQNLSEAEEEEMSNVKDEVSTSSQSRGGKFLKFLIVLHRHMYW